MSGNRSGVLELAVLGLLHETPLHGYELRKRLNGLLGAFRAFGYGSLYPCLKELLAQGLIAEDSPADTAQAAPPRHAGPAGQSRHAGLTGQARPRSGRRSKIVYRLTADGKERLQDLLAEAGPAAGRTTVSASTSPSSARPGPTSGCGSWKAGGPGWRSGSTASGR